MVRRAWTLVWQIPRKPCDRNVLCGMTQRSLPGTVGKIEKSLFEERAIRTSSRCELWGAAAR
jgi:hypothetical protein